MGRLTPNNPLDRERLRQHNPTDDWSSPGNKRASFGLFHAGRAVSGTLAAKLELSRKSRYLSDMAGKIVTTSPDIMGGTPVFPGTRVPVQTLLDYLEAGDSIDKFLAGFPSVSREKVVAFLERAAALAVHDAA